MSFRVRCYSLARIVVGGDPDRSPQVAMLSKLRHRNIVTFIGASFVPGKLMLIVTECLSIESL
jgi:hypothetical protein